MGAGLRRRAPGVCETRPGPGGCGFRGGLVKAGPWLLQILVGRVPCAGSGRAWSPEERLPERPEEQRQWS